MLFRFGGVHKRKSRKQARIPAERDGYRADDYRSAEDAADPDVKKQ